MYQNSRILEQPNRIAYASRTNGFGNKELVYAEIYGTYLLTLECRESADYDKLFGTIEQTEAYIQELKADPRKPSLDFYSWGYEEYEVSIVWTRSETSQEYDIRMAVETRYLMEREKWLKAEEKREQGLKEMARVKKKYGL